MIDYGLNDKVAVVTGANNPWGIGAATALVFAREGAKVVLVASKSLSTFLYTNTTFAPSRANARAVAAPIPHGLFAPVTTETLSFNP